MQTAAFLSVSFYVRWNLIWLMQAFVVVFCASLLVNRVKQLLGDMNHFLNHYLSWEALLSVQAPFQQHAASHSYGCTPSPRRTACRGWSVRRYIGRRGAIINWLNEQTTFFILISLSPLLSWFQLFTPPWQQTKYLSLRTSCWALENNFLTFYRSEMFSINQENN